MSAIDRRFAGRPIPRPQPIESVLARFHAARRAANLALVEWLRTGPDTAEVALEIDGTIAALRQLASLARGGTP